MFLCFYVQACYQGYKQKSGEGRRLCRKKNLPREWDARRTRQYFLESFPVVKQFKYMLGIANSPQMVEPPTQQLRPADFHRTVKTSKLYIVPTELYEEVVRLSSERCCLK